MHQLKCCPNLFVAYGYTQLLFKQWKNPLGGKKFIKSPQIYIFCQSQANYSFYECSIWVKLLGYRITTETCFFIKCLFTFILCGVPVPYVVCSTLHFRELSRIVTSELKPQVKTHRGTPTIFLALHFTLYLFLSLSLSLAVFLFQHVSKKSAWNINPLSIIVGNEAACYFLVTNHQVNVCHCPLT